MVVLPVAPVTHRSMLLVAPGLAPVAPVTYGWSHSTTMARKSPGGMAGTVTGSEVVLVAPVVSKLSK